MPLAIMANRLDPPSFQCSDLNILEFVNINALTTGMNFTIRKNAGNPMDRFPESANFTRWESPRHRPISAIGFSFVLIAQHRLMNEMKDRKQPFRYGRITMMRRSLHVRKPDTVLIYRHNDCRVQKHHYLSLVRILYTCL